LADTLLPENAELDEIARSVRQIVEENRKFLVRIMDDDFEEESESEAGEGPPLEI